MTQEIKVIGSISIVTIIILVAGVFFLSKNDQEKTNPILADTTVLNRNANHTISAANSKVTLVEFADFQCPACASAHPIIKKILQDYKGQITFMYRHFPLPQHKNAVIAAKASEAAGAEARLQTSSRSDGGQGKFWEMYNKLYEEQNKWAESENPAEIFIEYAKELGLDVDTFSKVLTSNEYVQTIEKDREDGILLGVNSTPTFFLNGKKLILDSFADISKEIDKEL